MLDFLMKVLWIAEIIVGLGLLIFIHELGHFLMAKRNRVRVEVFSLGFGPAIWKRRRGDTEYRISWIPLGGYVKMAGEGVGMGSGKPDELTSKSAWQRLQIFTAGALMNLIIAFPICIVGFLVGKFEMSPEVGVPGVPETYAGMLPGDVILRVDGVPVETGDHYRIEMVRKPRGVPVPVVVLRGGQEITLNVVQSGSESHRTLPPSTTLPDVAAGSALAKAGVKSGDDILAVNGKRITTGQQLLDTLREAGGQDATLQVRRRSGGSGRGEEFSTSLVLPAKSIVRLPDDANLREAVIEGVEKKFPADGKLEKGDIVRKIDGREVRSYQDLKDVVETAVRPLRSLQVEVERGGERKTFEIVPTFGDSGKGVLGVGIRPTRVFAAVPEGSHYHQQGLRSGDVLLSVEGNVGEISVTTLLGYAVPAGKDSVHLEVRRGEKQIPLDVKAVTKQECDFTALGIPEKGGRYLLDFARLFRKRSFVEAVKDGVREPVDIVVLTYQLLYKLVKREESTKGMAGPLGIADAAYRSAELSFGNLLWLLALITVNLGIFNLLPIPILDGGHVVLLAIEKLRGKPPSERFIAIFQYAGLIFLLALIVFVTYNDISRFVGR